MEPADGLPAGLSVSLASAVAAEGASADGVDAAFDAADAVRVRLRRGGQAVVDVTRGFSAQSAGAPIRVEVRLEGGEEALGLEVSLLFQGDPVFEAERAVTLRTGETTAAEVTLVPVPAAVSLAGGPVALEAIGAEAQLAAAVVFATGDEIPELLVTWTSSAPEVVGVDQTGRVTALAPGDAEVRAAHEGLEASAAVTVEQAAASVTVEPAEAEISAIGEELTLEAEAFDANGHPIPLGAEDFAWSSSDESVITVSPDGTATAEDVGTATIRAERDGQAGEAVLTVRRRAATVTVDPAEAEIVGIGNTLPLTATAFDASGEPIPLEPSEFEWSSSDDEVATVSAEGVVTALDEGTATITAARDDAEGTSVVTVEREVANVTVEPSSAEASEVGQTVAFTARAFGQDGNLLTSDPEDFEWASSNQSAATVSSAGVATATGAGSTIISATREGRTGSAVLEVALPVPVNFADPLLEGAVRSAIDKPSGQIFDTDLQDLIELFAAELGISDLGGIEFATELQELQLASNEISDLSPLSGLGQLTSLSLGGNLISDLSPIGGLSALTELDLAFNEISDLSPIASLTGLVFLFFDGNSVSDLSPLGGMLQLEMLGASDNSISDLAPLQGLTALGLLQLQSNAIVDVAALVNNAGLGEGDSVNLTDNPLGVQAMCQDIPELIDRGVDVVVDGGCP